VQAAPNGFVGESVAHFSTIVAKPMSLPPIVIVTSAVPVVSAFSWGGLLPSGTDCAAVRSSVFAPLQLTSVSVAPVRAATSDA